MWSRWALGARIEEPTLRTGTTVLVIAKPGSRLLYRGAPATLLIDGPRLLTMAGWEEFCTLVSPDS